MPVVKLPRTSAGARRWVPAVDDSTRALPAPTTCPSAAYVHARIFGRKRQCLLDSGADVSLIPAHFVPAQHVLGTPPRSLYAANDTEIIVEGQVTAPLSVQRHSFQSTFLVCKNVDEVILGRDWLATHRAIWNFDSDQVTVNGHRIPLSCKNLAAVPRCKRCRVGVDVEIPPLSEAVIPAVKIFGHFSAVSDNEQWTTVPSEPVSGLRVARTLVSSDSPAIAVRVCNITRRPITLREGQSVSVLQNVQLNPVHTSTPVVDERTAQQQRQSIVNNVDPSVPEACKTRLSNLVDSYHDVFSYSEYDLGETDLVQHEINTKDHAPFRQPLRPQPRARLPVIDSLLMDMQAQGIIEPCQSEWASNIVLVTKKDGSVRFCVDYRKLNTVTQKDVYPLPRIETCLDTLSGSAWYSTFDLRSGFHQVKVHPRDANKTTFTCHKGTFRFTKMPFGLCNAPATFQRLMDTVLMGLNFDICLAYLDDIIVFSRDLQGHLERLEQLFARLREANLKLKPSKCTLLQRKVSFLGYTLSEAGVSTDPSKIQAVQNWPVPANLRQCRAFVGLCQYYRRFVPNFSAVAAPLHALTKKGAPFKWTHECQVAFQQLKDALVSADVLALPSDEGQFVLDCDASDLAIGAVLSQVQNGEERPICYASQLYDSHQKNYNVTRKELLALVTFVKKFRQYLLGRSFLIRTDHAALQWLRRTPEPIGQQARWLEILEEFDFTVQHRPGSQHVNADALSRRIAVTHDTATEHSPNVDWPSVQREDPVIGEIYTVVQNGTTAPSPESLTACSAEVKNLYAQLHAIKISSEGILYRVFTDADTGQTFHQTIVPRALRREIVDDLHRGLNGGHLGHRRAKKLLRKRFFWPGWSRDVELAKSRCDQCARFHRPRPHRQGDLQPMIVGEPWERLGIDITGPHPASSRGNAYILTVIDHFSKWVELFPMRNQEASTVAKILVDRVFCVHGCPLQILTDQGPNFESVLFQELCKLLAIDKIRTTPYKPSTNGNIERFHATMHNMLAKLVSENQRDWDQHLSAVAFAYRTSVQESTGFTPYFLLFGREARIPADLVYGPPPDAPRQDGLPEFVTQQRETLDSAYQLARKHLGTAAQRRKRQYDLRTRNQEFPVDSMVWVYVPRRRVGRYQKWRSPYQGPFRVLKRLGPVNYLVQRSPKSKPWVTHVDKLKACYHDIEDACLAPQPGVIVDSNTEDTDAETPQVQRPHRTVRVPARYRD